MNWIIENWETVTAGSGAIFGVGGVWWGWLAHRVKKQLVDAIGLTNFHNDEIRLVCAREQKFAALRAMKPGSKLLP